MRSFLGVLFRRVGLFGHYILELRPKALDLAELVANLPYHSQRMYA
jgi:hypothetical protein